MKGRDNNSEWEGGDINDRNNETRKKKTDREREREKKKTSMYELVGDEWSKCEDAMHNQKHGGLECYGRTQQKAPANSMINVK